MIGIIPAAGDALRMFQIPKFLLPIDDSYLLACLQSRMHRAGARDVYTGVHPRHYNLPALRPERTHAYYVETDTMNETVLAARDKAGDQDVLFGMPDTYWTDEDVYIQLAYELGRRSAVAAVALWNTPREYISKRGMIMNMDGNRILEIKDKPQGMFYHQNLCWGAMAWSSTFWQYILPEDAHVGFALQRAIDAGQEVQGVVMDGQFWDCGTPDEYFDCIRALGKVKA